MTLTAYGGEETVVLWEYGCRIFNFFKKKVPEIQILMWKVLTFKHLPLYTLFFNRTLCGEIKLVSELPSNHLWLLITLKYLREALSFAFSQFFLSCVSVPLSKHVIMGRDFFFLSWNFKYFRHFSQNLLTHLLRLEFSFWFLPHTHVVFTILALVRLRGAIHEFWYYLSWASWAPGTEASVSPTVSEPRPVAATGHFCVSGNKGSAHFQGLGFHFIYGSVYRRQ